MAVGERISELRKRKEISQEKLAEMVGVSRQAVTKWENGNANPDTENLIRLAEIFGVSLDELCKVDSEKPKTHWKQRIFELVLQWLGNQKFYR